MKKNRTFSRISALFMLIMTSVFTAGCTEKIIILNPKGTIGKQQLDLMVTSTLLCLIVIVPVLILTVWIIWRYRKKPNRKAKYTPEWEHSTKLEIIWWGIPILIIIALGVITVRSTYALEPSKALASDKKPITIQVASLDWKWLFMYPEEGIATVNYVQFPEDTPIRFELTADAPMNSFWIPQLGGQMYTMSGMNMALYLQADEKGEYFGSGANFSGREFGSMKFVAKATTEEGYKTWIQDVKKSNQDLSLEGYKALAEPGVTNTLSYSSFPKNLFEQIVTKYAPSHNHGPSNKPIESDTKTNVKVDMNMKMDHMQHAGH
ncbi:ubiquinol oxidase subunit II [Paenibacillus sp. TAF58]